MAHQVNGVVAGTKGEASCKRSGKAKLANDMHNNEIGVETAETIGEGKVFSINKAARVHPQVKKQRDS